MITKAAWRNCWFQRISVEVKQSEITFTGAEGIDLDAHAKAQLQVMLEFMKADPSVNHIELDGHSDNSGNRLANRELSRRRALAVMDYSGQRHSGIADHHALPRALPLAPNTNAANRAKNCRCRASGNASRRRRKSRLKGRHREALRRPPEPAEIVARSTESVASSS